MPKQRFFLANLFCGQGDHPAKTGAFIFDLLFI
jgi:hypothetical protein